jgi:XTP/dITP diphosphohydrolase
MTIYLASGNSHKKQELTQLFPGCILLTPAEAGVAFTAEETGNTFIENAGIKAAALWDKVKAPVLADDSGLCVDVLGGKPGIYSARYGGSVPQEEKNRLLLEEVNAALAGSEENPPTCRFVCAMLLLLSPDRFFAVQETMEGSLVKTIGEARGGQGFGYDPVFIPQGYDKTLAELAPEEKNRISHRGRAARALDKIIPLLYDNPV